MLTPLLVTVALSVSAAPAADDVTTPAPSAATVSVATDSGSASEPGKKTADPVTKKKAKKKTKKQTDRHLVRATWKQHPSIRVGSAFRLDLKMMLQEDAHATSVESPDLETFELRRNRIGVSGDLFKHIEFEFEREFLDGHSDPGKVAKSSWKDAYVNIDVVKNVQVQAGRFKIPFGLDQLTPITRNDFVNRSLGATYLAPARDLGAMAHGRFFRHGLNYWAGVFAHDGDNARSSKTRGGDETLAARVTGTPFRRLGPRTTEGTEITEKGDPERSRCARCARWLADIEVGTAFSASAISGDSPEPNGLRGRTVMTEDTFFHPVFVKGHRTRWEVDVDWKTERASARAEYTWVGDNRLQQGLGDDTLPDARARSWYVSGSWQLFAAPANGRSKGAHRILWDGWGSLEAVSRYERVWFDSAGGSDAGVSFRNPRAEHIWPSGDRVLTVGVNWTLNRWLRLQVNGIRERIEDPERSPAANGAAFWSPVCRVQFVL